MSFSVLKIFAVFVIFGRFGCGIQFNCYDCSIEDKDNIDSAYYRNDCNAFDNNTRIKKCSQCGSAYTKETDPSGQTINSVIHGCADSFPGCNRYIDL